MSCKDLGKRGGGEVWVYQWVHILNRMKECVVFWRWGPMVFISLHIPLWDTRYQNTSLPGRRGLKWWKFRMIKWLFCLIPLLKTNSILFHHLFCQSSLSLPLPPPPSPSEEEGLESEEFWCVFFLLQLVSLLTVLIPQHPFPICLSLPPPTTFFSFSLEYFSVALFVLRRVVLILHFWKWENNTGQELLGERVAAVPGGFIYLLYKSPCCPQSAKLLINGTARCHIFPL